MMKKSFRHGKLGGSNLNAEGNVSGEENVEKSSDKTVPRRLKKGATPQQLMDTLQNAILANGLEPYNQFKKMGIESLTDENGNPTFN